MAELTVAKCTADVMRWIIDNEHHHGYWVGPSENRMAFFLEGKNAKLKIPVDVHKPGMMAGSDYRKTNRMYEPTPAGRSALQEATRS